uniref:hypothetical protein n=1 Tax=Psychrobacter sp. TaxID=56811 RepID=UPI00159B51C0|nr:hypothetical protein [Psychrobacter sp.]QJS05714.1 hypothetical protein [Psychrobacter sp.]
MKYQSGTTLISLLIGLLISMLCIIAVLSSYRTIVKTGVESRVAATHDTQLQTGLATAQMFLQNAGFGLEGTDYSLATPIKVDSKDIKALLWRYKDDNNTTICQGLADIESSDGEKRRFVLLENNSTCDAPLNSDKVNWKVQTTLANLEDYSTNLSNPEQVTFEETLTTCTPFGAGVLDNVPHPLITITAQTSTQQSAGLGKAEIRVCLLNIVSP